MRKKETVISFLLIKYRHLFTFPGRLQPSIINVNELNFRVRNGNGCDLIAISTDLLFKLKKQKQINERTQRNKRKSPRPISTCKLNVSPRLHIRPIKLIVYERSYSYDGISYLKVGFTLRCLQRLSVPHIAAQLCHWRDNWCTRGASIPVLSY